MIIVGTPKDYKYMTKRCDGRCLDGEWCIFEDQTTCPVHNDDNFIVVVENKIQGIEVE